jgi:hypothetical protein
MIYSFVSANRLSTPCNESPLHSAQLLVGVLAYLNQVLSTSFDGCTPPALCTVTVQQTLEGGEARRRVHLLPWLKPPSDFCFPRVEWNVDKERARCRRSPLSIVLSR